MLQVANVTVISNSGNNITQNITYYNGTSITYVTTVTVVNNISYQNVTIINISGNEPGAGPSRAPSPPLPLAPCAQVAGTPVQPST